jgi:DNA polymerase-3 subunit gamma/tau
MARILAKAVNCESGPTPNPCQSCAPCQATTSGHSTDVFEIDGASNRGIDEVRELRETIKYAPMQGRYKIYIVDEVHMLTKEAFNALLKTLEEPPAHVIFILATTEAHKIPSTILSRCQHFQFRRMTRHEIMARLQEIGAREGFSLTTSCATVLAKAADGSMRDALSLLDQAVAYSGKNISEENLEVILGTPRREVLVGLITAVVEHRTAESLSMVQTVLDQGYDLRQFASEMVEHWRNLLIIKVADGASDLLDFPTEEVAVLHRIADPLSEEEARRLFGIFAQALDLLRTATHPRFIIEMAIIKATRPPPLQSLENMIQRLEKFEREATGGANPPTPSQAPKPAPSPSSQSLTAEPAAQEPFLAIHWENLIRRIRDEKPSLASFLEMVTPVNLVNDQILVGYSQNTDFLVDLIQKEEYHSIIKKVLKELFGRPVQLKLFRLESSSTTVSTKTASSQAKPIKNEIKSHPIVKDALDILGGEIIAVRKPLNS